MVNKSYSVYGDVSAAPECLLVAAAQSTFSSLFVAPSPIIAAPVVPAQYATIAYKVVRQININGNMARKSSYVELVGELTLAIL